MVQAKEMLDHIDYGENYANKEQKEETWSAYFEHWTFTIFIACHSNFGEDGRLIKRNITITSEVPNC